MLSSPEELASLLLIPEGGLESQTAQIAHRQEMIAQWGGIPSGAKVLELGCGQGDCTIVIADCVGGNGSVDGVDPAPPEYGRPYTVEQMRKHISASRLGPRIKWIRADALQYLREHPTDVEYDICILAHCLWYFHSTDIIATTFQLLSSVCKRIYISEWSLYSSLPEAQPHILAALAAGSLACRKPENEANVRTVISPAAIKKLAGDSGLKIVKEGKVIPKEMVLDGQWEVTFVSDEGFVEEVKEIVENERERAVIFAQRDAMLRSVEAIDGGKKGVRSMDVWCGVFEKA